MIIVLSKAWFVFVSIRAIFSGVRIKIVAIKLIPFIRQITSVSFIDWRDPDKLSLLKLYKYTGSYLVVSLRSTFLNT